MKKIVHHIRSKPYETRTKIVWVAAIITTALLMGAWMIIGINKPKVETKLFETVNKDYQEGKTKFPDLFPKK